MPAHFPVAAITDEFSPDIETAVLSMAALGMTGAELRMVFGKNIVDLSDAELARAIEIVRAAGLEIVSIASPLLKCVLPDSPEVDARFQQDMFAAVHTFADQPRLTARALEIAGLSAAPEACSPPIVEALRARADQAARQNLIIGLENEHACNIATGAETARLLAALDHPNLKVVWDPANAVVSGEKAFPEGYGKLP